MPPIDQGTILPNLLFGVLAVGIGIVVVLRRRSLFRSTVRDLKVVSRVASRAVGRSSSPLWVGAAGAVFIGVGLLMIGAALAGLVQLAA
ncbi:hypothetical protein [Microbacterium lacus]|uniref:hypothetical protein n=1 Tax=Microbacterium lacus TaxID=415217 RepID=UPI0031D95431